MPEATGSIEPFNSETLQNVIRLRNDHPKLKILAAVGGGLAGSNAFSQVHNMQLFVYFLLKQLFYRLHERRIDDNFLLTPFQNLLMTTILTELTLTGNILIKEVEYQKIRFKDLSFFFLPL